MSTDVCSFLGSVAWESPVLLRNLDEWRGWLRNYFLATVTAEGGRLCAGHCPQDCTGVLEGRATEPACSLRRGFVAQHPNASGPLAYALIEGAEDRV